MCSPSAPPAPNYVGAAQATGQSNIQAAIVNSMLNRVNQNTPYGSLSYNQTGTKSVGGQSGTAPVFAAVFNPETGQMENRMVQEGTPGQPGVDVPTFESNVNLSPTGQQLLDADTSTKLGLAGAEGTSLDQLKSAIGESFDAGAARAVPASGQYNKEVSDALYGRQTNYLDPQFEKQGRQLEDDLVSRGFSVGEEGYSKAHGDFDRAKELAYSNARDSAISGGVAAGQTGFQQALQGHQADIADMLMQRQQPLQELNALRTGAMPQNPNFPGVPGAQPVAGTNYSDAAKAAGGWEQAMYGANVGTANSNNAAMAGIIAAMFASDRRLKRNVKRIGLHKSGVGLYRFRYLDSDQLYIGVMADELKAIRPDLVVRMAGFDRVNYLGLAWLT